MFSNKRVFITGGAGFIGSSLAERLVPANEVVLYDNLTRNALRPGNAVERGAARLIEGDVRDEARLRAVLTEIAPTHLVHCAAIAGIDATIRSPVTTLEVNGLGTANLLRAAKTLGALERVVCFSTSEVFGQRAFQSDEDSKAVIGTVGVARWTYAVSKLSSEHLAIAYHGELGLPTTVVRPFNVYGPGQVGEGALAAFVQRALRHQPLEVHGQGSQIRAWCYIDDMVRGVMMALEDPRAVGETFNIGNQRAVVTIYGLANAVIRVLASRSSIQFVRQTYVDVELRVPNVEKARRMLGFEATVDLEDGIERTARYFERLAREGGGAPRA